MTQVETDEMRRERLVNKIYDVVLHPEDHSDFMMHWAKHVEALAPEFDSRRNSSGPAESVLQDDGLEIHFARAHAIIEKLGRTTVRLAQPEQDVSYLFQFDVSGERIGANPDMPDAYQQIQYARQMTSILDAESDRKWQEFITKMKRAPSIGNYIILLEAGRGNLVAYGQRQLDGDQISIVVRRLCVHWTDDLVSVLSTSFQLSPKELELCRNLTATGSLNAIAEQGGKSKHTLRAQLKSIFQKMNVSSQPDLMQTIVALSHVCCHLNSDPHLQDAGPHLGDIETLTLDSGAQMIVHFFGPRLGRPVVFVHGMLDGVSVTSDILSALEAHNIRMIAPIRPGFGAAEVGGAIKTVPEDFAKLLGESLRHLHVSGCVLAGHMSGSVFTFAASAHLGQRVIGIANISGGVPILSTKQFSTVAPRQRAVAYTARYAPAFLPLILRAGVAQIDAMRTKELMAEMYPVGLRDCDVVQNEAIAAVVADGYRFAVAQGYKAFQADAYHVTRDWSEFVENSHVPVVLIHGAHDPVVPIHTVREFADREAVELCEFPDEGQLILYSNPEAVIAKIAHFFDQCTDKARSED